MEIEAESALGRTTNCLKWIENPMNLLVAVPSASESEIKKPQLFMQTTRFQKVLALCTTAGILRLMASH
jgi:hypothetical protein